MSLLRRFVGAVAERLFPPRIDTAEALRLFVGRKSAYVAQTALFGYLKTRMGTQFPAFFQDEGFAALIRAGSVKLFVSCAGDLAVHAAGAVGEGNRLAPEECAALARQLFDDALRQALAEQDRPAVPDAVTGFAGRVAGVEWGRVAIGEAAFAGSNADVVRFAPVSEEFKALDRTIVRNSIRFLWRNVRGELARRLDSVAVAEDWRSRARG